MIVAESRLNRAAELVDEGLGLVGLERVKREAATIAGEIFSTSSGAVRSVSTKPLCTATTAVPWRLSSIRAAFVKFPCCGLGCRIG